jgi:chromosome segregation ATPase
MSVEQQLTPARAAEILATLEEKDATLCRYPGCPNPRIATTKTGRPAVYCDNPEHNAVNNHRALKQLRAIVASANGETTTKSEERSSSGGIVAVETLRNSVVSRISQLQSDLDSYLAALAQIADPDFSAAQIQAALDQAESRVAEVQQHLSTERSLRLAAEAARTVAEAETQAEREAADLAIQQMEEAEASIQLLKEETKQQIEEIQTERDEAVSSVRIEAQHQVEEIQRQAKEAIVQAQTETSTAQEEARQANTHAHETETNARAQIAIAEQLANEARASLDRERAEVDRLRKELTATVAEARTRAEADRAEARASLDRERAEVDRLRKELATTRARADQLATLSDDLRAQLMQTQREKSNQ